MPANHKALILDANILIRAVLGPKVRNLILDNAEKVRFFVPEVCFADAKNISQKFSQKKVLIPLSLSTCLMA